mmetsp:Transcript_11985/g.38111  ORF Transcript_11985/g.38111 Transcript_11985/m.38111 type:complete len:233 (+) Transcript_11985:1021-1719(+)
MRPPDATTPRRRVALVRERLRSIRQPAVPAHRDLPRPAPVQPPQPLLLPRPFPGLEPRRDPGRSRPLELRLPLRLHQLRQPPQGHGHQLHHHHPGRLVGDPRPAPRRRRGTPQRTLHLRPHPLRQPRRHQHLRRHHRRVLRARQRRRDELRDPAPRRLSRSFPPLRDGIDTVAPEQLDRSFRPQLLLALPLVEGLARQHSRSHPGVGRARNRDGLRARLQHRHLVALHEKHR